MTDEEKKQLEQFIREHFKKEDFAVAVLFVALWLKIDIQGLSLEEASEKVAHAINSMSKEEFNSRLVDKIMNAMNARKKKNELVSSEVVRPKQFVSPNTKASNRMFGENNEKYYLSFRELAVEGQRSRKEISVSLFVRYDASVNVGIKMSAPYEGRMLTLFDRVVYDAVVTQFVNGGNNAITTNMIYQVISGNSEDKSAANHVSKSLSVAISESIDRLFHSYVEIDATQQAQAYGFDEGLYKGHLINGTIIEGKLNGQVTTCIYLCETPILYRYANNCGQVIRYDVKMLDVPGLENSQECIVLKTYLLQRIQIMKHHKEHNRTIAFDTLYALLNIQSTSEAALRMKKKQIRDHTTKCLDYWKAEGLIQGYEIQKTGKVIDRVTLTVKLVKFSSISTKLVSR